MRVITHAKALKWMEVVVANFLMMSPATDAATPISVKVTPKPWFDGRLRTFFRAKSEQAHQLASGSYGKVAPEMWSYFDAGVTGDWAAVTNLFQKLSPRMYQFGGHDEGFQNLAWQPMNETFIAWNQLAVLDRRYALAFADGILTSVPPGSIYLGGTDAGRGLITALCKSHAGADPFFTVTQNALVDHLYLEYLHEMYGSRMFTPSREDSRKCYDAYLVDAQRRLKENKLLPGEQPREIEGKVPLHSVVSVRAISGMIVKLMFDKNPERDFYVQESFPLEWTYPHALPHQFIYKINRQPMQQLPMEVVLQDRNYWSAYIRPLIGDWLHMDTSLADVRVFVQTVHVQHEFQRFTGDKEFMDDVAAQALFSKLRLAIAGIYAWRVEHAATPGDRLEMTRAADFAFRQAWSLCPLFPEVVVRYADFLASQNRLGDAMMIAETARKAMARSARLPPGVARDDASIAHLLQRLKSANSN